MPMYPWPSADAKHTEEQQVPLGVLAVGNTDVTITWNMPFTSSTSYSISPSIEQGTASIGQQRPVIKQGSVTPAGCTITIVNSAVVAVAAGAVLHVIAVEG